MGNVTSGQGNNWSNIEFEPPTSSSIPDVPPRVTTSGVTTSGVTTSGSVDEFTNSNIFDSKKYETPLNKFIEDVFNKKYFISAKLNDNILNQINYDDDENKNVLMKRSYCTGKSRIAISLPVVRGNTIKDYSVKIHTHHLDGTRLTDINDLKASIDTDNDTLSAENLYKIEQGESIPEGVDPNVVTRIQEEYVKRNNTPLS